MAEMKDGGPAFPLYCVPGDLMNASGMSLRDYLAARAPTDEIQEIGGTSAKECAVYLGIENYEFPKHYLMLLAKARYQWADAMLAERAK